jgi:hypothetical protein
MKLHLYLVIMPRPCKKRKPARACRRTLRTKSGENGCPGKNSCKGKGGCGVPVKGEEKKDKSSCKGF